MAARINPNHKAEVRERIKVSQLLNRLQKNALETECMTQGQLKSAEILLRKALPDLSAVTIGGDPNGAPVHLNIVSGVPRAGD